ncbi:PREDICTED: probable aminotransferase TAT2 isoform X2 [Tarenaya hassleriana]|uniref:probable aminotransferase TAT2 isoform X2 n=1 Tax=Tarenaya hassleriana TaxID=28532 RepID=UPI00053C3C7B|nr:PREDICTED: probable aminotransferase TAT2 isoform X2 [Tarenaya hassleriana]
MENNGAEKTVVTIKGTLSLLRQSIEEEEEEERSKRIISLGMGDPTEYSCFRTTKVAEEAVSEALLSHNFHGYAPTVGLPLARRAIAEHLSRDLPYKLTQDDVFITSGCTQAIDVALTMLARPGANILLPRPGFPIYELCAKFRHLQVRFFDLLPEKGWEIDLDTVGSLVDQNTVALVVINPGSPCGNVYSCQHLEKIAETAKKLGILVIADEVYGHLAFGSKPFVPMGVFGSTVPVLTLGSLSKRWIVPGWRLGWLVITDPFGSFKSPKIIERFKKYFDILGGPVAFIQAAVPKILEHTDEQFFKKTLKTLKNSSDICYERIKEIPCMDCPQRPEGSMAMMIKLNLSLLEDVSDDVDFCFKLAREESVIVLPGTVVGMKNWLRMTFAADRSSLDEAFKRIKCFYLRHSNKSMEL